MSTEGLKSIRDALAELSPASLVLLSDALAAAALANPQIAADAFRDATRDLIN
jgi:hypothetical protein